MHMKFRYTETENLVIHSISVIGAFNDYDLKKGRMKKVDHAWEYECQLGEGEHLYKFIVNGGLRLNDPLANIYYPDDKEELWSVIIIDKEAQRLYNNITYSLHINDYSMIGTVDESKSLPIKKKFHYAEDEKVVLKYEFTNVTGLHEVTIAWFQPNGSLFQTVANNLYNPQKEENSITLWFWLDLKEKNIQFPVGEWLYKLFVDGEYILEDSFLLEGGNTYTVKAKYK